MVMPNPITGEPDCRVATPPEIQAVEVHRPMPRLHNRKRLPEEHPDFVYGLRFGAGFAIATAIVWGIAIVSVLSTWSAITEQ